MRLILILVFVSLTLSAKALIIEDSADRLEFELFWGPPRYSPFPSMNAYVPLGLGNNSYEEFGSGGSRLALFSRVGNDQYAYELDIQRVINGVTQPTTATVIRFSLTRGSQDEFLPPSGDYSFGGLNSPFHPSDYMFAVPGNDYAVRIIIGLPHPDIASVPDTGSTLVLLIAAISFIGVYHVLSEQRRSGEKVPERRRHFSRTNQAA